MATQTQPETGSTDPRPAADGALLAGVVKDLAGWDRVYPASALSFGRAWMVAGRWGRQRGVAFGFPTGRPPAWFAGLSPPSSQPEETAAEDAAPEAISRAAGGMTVSIRRADHDVLRALREALPFLRPRPAGAGPSFGFGDRLGLATPGHLAALREGPVFPLLAQQSIREMTRTRRTPDEVMDAAVFGALQCGWTSGFGADADHLKTPEDVDRMAEAGFVFFTIDPSAHVDDTVRQASDAELEAKYRQIAAEVEGASRWETRYLDTPFEFAAKGGRFTVTLDVRALREAAVKYGRAAAHAASLAAHVARRMAGRPFEIEVSVDETATPTTPGEHLFIVRELRERGVAIHSLAPRFVGDFEKGIDYKGDLAEFERSIERHAAIARAHGGYKISVHSGSDKFSAYPAVARATEGLLHVKTAGTSYLEALRVAARKDPALFREVAAFARSRYETDKATYHVSARLDAVPAPDALKDADLERAYLEDDGGRQILHVTFGSVLTAVGGASGPDSAGEGASRGSRPEVAPTAWLFRDRLLDLLVREEETYTEVLARHLGKHVRLLGAP